MFTEIWEAFFDSLPPSREWAPLLVQSVLKVLSAFSVWLIARIGLRRNYTVQLICSLLIHVCLFFFAVLFGCQDGWPKLAVTKSLGRTIVVLVFVVTSYTSYYEQG